MLGGACDALQLYGIDRLEIAFHDADHRPILQAGVIRAAGRLGGWPAGPQGLDQADVVLFFGTNPLVSHSALGAISADPVKRLKAAHERVLQLIVIDPRRSETANYATLAVPLAPAWPGLTPLAPFAPVVP
jgi:anaerobic selenocysteine-containing dehydrogenase